MSLQTQVPPTLHGGFYWFGSPALADIAGAVNVTVCHRPAPWRVAQWLRVTLKWLRG